MKIRRRTKMKKWLISLFAVIMVFAMLPNFAFAAETEKGSIVPITEGGTAKGDGITVESSNLTWYAKDNSVGRYQDGWWIGVKIVAPAFVDTSDKADNVRYSNDGTDNLVKNFGQNKDGEWWMGCWVLVVPEYLEQALENDTTLQWTYKFDWDGDNAVDQTFTITITPDNITLMDKDNPDKEYFKTTDGVIAVKDGAHVHTYGKNWESDETNHWHECITCEGVEKDKTDIAEHTFGEWEETTPATEAATGEKERTCSICGYKETAEIPMLKHTHSYGTEWKSDGTSHWHECITCEGVEKDKTDMTEHTFGEWEETTPATEAAAGEKERTCSVCGYKETAEIPMLKHTHSYGTEWKSDGTSHWHECACGEKTDLATHTMKWVVDKEATEAEKGSMHEECSICGSKGAVAEIPVKESAKPPVVETPATEAENPAAPANPHTGDNSILGLCITLLFLSSAGITRMAFYGRRKRKAGIPLIKI